MYKDKVDKDLNKYIEENIIPLYDKLDLSHKSDHVYDVIESSFDIAKDYNVNYDIVFAVAAFHDLGLLVNRKEHHSIGAKMVREDSFLNNYFTKEEIEIIADAVFDHRASSKDKPRTIYGLIVSVADMYDSSFKIIERTILYRLNKDENIDFQKLFLEVKEHISEKYGYNGYLNSWLNSKRVNQMLYELRNYLDKEEDFKKICLNIYLNLR